MIQLSTKQRSPVCPNARTPLPRPDLADTGAASNGQNKNLERLNPRRDNKLASFKVAFCQENRSTAVGSVARGSLDPLRRAIGHDITSIGDETPPDSNVA